jgi:hypothetical protein
LRRKCSRSSGLSSSAATPSPKTRLQRTGFHSGDGSSQNAGYSSHSSVANWNRKSPLPIDLRSLSITVLRACSLIKGKVLAGDLETNVRGWKSTETVAFLPIRYHEKSFFTDFKPLSFRSLEPTSFHLLIDSKVVELVECRAQIRGARFIGRER